MKYYFFVDETGDHSLSHINEDFPYFLLCGILMREDVYQRLVWSIEDFKKKYFGSTEVILHSRDIRKCDKQFKILFDLDVKKDFYTDLDSIIRGADFQIISIGIRKIEYVKKYGISAINPYQISLSYMLERLIFCLNTAGGNSVEILVEKRGRKEDRDLLEHYNRILSRGTYYVSSPLFREIITGFDFREKQKNDIGIQLADLCAYPLISHIRRPNEPNLAYDILKPKIYQKDGKLYGLKIHP